MNKTIKLFIFSTVTRVYLYFSSYVKYIDSETNCLTYTQMPQNEQGTSVIYLLLYSLPPPLSCRRRRSVSLMEGAITKGGRWSLVEKIEWRERTSRGNIFFLFFFFLVRAVSSWDDEKVITEISFRFGVFLDKWDEQLFCGIFW